MLPRKIAHDAPDVQKAIWRIVRLDTHQQLDGAIVSADCDTGVAVMKVKDEAKEHSFGPGGIAIIGR